MSHNNIKAHIVLQMFKLLENTEHPNLFLVRPPLHSQLFLIEKMSYLYVGE